MLIRFAKVKCTNKKTKIKIKLSHNGVCSIFFKKYINNALGTKIINSIPALVPNMKDSSNIKKPKITVIIEKFEATREK